MTPVWPVIDNFRREHKAYQYAWVTWPCYIMQVSWNILRENDLFDPCDPYMTSEVKLLITFVAIHPLVILTKFG